MSPRYKEVALNSRGWIKATMLVERKNSTVASLRTSWMKMTWMTENLHRQVATKIRCEQYYTIALVSVGKARLSTKTVVLILIVKNIWVFKLFLIENSTKINDVWVLIYNFKWWKQKYQESNYLNCVKSFFASFVFIQSAGSKPSCYFLGWLRTTVVPGPCRP